MPRPTLLSLGSINADFQVRTHQPPGSSETLLAYDFCRFAGGKASNTAWLGAQFGHRSLLLGRVGDDNLAEQALGTLREAGVDISSVGRAAGQATGLSMIMVPPDGKKHIVLATNANDCWTERAIESVVSTIASTSAPACLVADCEVPAEVVHRALRAAKERRIQVVLDPSFPDRVEASMFEHLYAVTPNASEAERVLNMQIRSPEQAAEAAAALRNKGVSIACVKLGDGGCVLDAGEGAWHVAGSQTDPVDTTGAGDCFTGVFAIGLLERLSALEAAAWAVAATNHAVTRYGSKPGYPNREEVVSATKPLLSKARRLHA